MSRKSTLTNDVITSASLHIAQIQRLTGFKMHTQVETVDGMKHRGEVCGFRHDMAYDLWLVGVRWPGSRPSQDLEFYLPRELIHG